MSGNKPIVSVLIPAYNHEKYVQETIQSVIDQTYENIELLVVDDGSKDNTWEKIQELKEVCEKRFTRVHFETKENEGTCATLNKLLSLAKGEYIGLFASDDLYKPQLIEKEVNFLLKNPDYVLCVGDSEIIDSNSKKCFWNKDRKCLYKEKDAKFKTFCDFLKQERKEIDFNSDDFGLYKSLYVGNYIPNGHLIRKFVVDKIGKYSKEAPLEDWWLMLQLSKHGKFKYLDEVLYSYRWHETNAVKNTENMNKMLKQTRDYENKILIEINKNNSFDKYLPIVKDVYENGVKRVARNYFNIIKVITSIYPLSVEKKVDIELFGIKIYSFNKTI